MLLISVSLTRGWDRPTNNYKKCNLPVIFPVRSLVLQYALQFSPTRIGVLPLRIGVLPLRTGVLPLRITILPLRIAVLKGRIDASSYLH